MSEFDYDQLDEFTSHSLKKASKEINELRKNIGEAIYKTGSLKSKNNDFISIVKVGMDEIGAMPELQEALICVGIYLESEAYGNIK